MIYRLLASLSEELLTAGHTIFANERLITTHITIILFFVFKVAKQETPKKQDVSSKTAGYYYKETDF